MRRLSLAFAAVLVVAACQSVSTSATPATTRRTRRARARAVPRYLAIQGRRTGHLLQPRDGREQRLDRQSRRPRHHVARRQRRRRGRRHGLRARGHLSVRRQHRRRRLHDHSHGRRAHRGARLPRDRAARREPRHVSRRERQAHAKERHRTSRRRRSRRGGGNGRGAGALRHDVAWPTSSHRRSVSPTKASSSTRASCAASNGYQRDIQRFEGKRLFFPDGQVIQAGTRLSTAGARVDAAPDRRAWHRRLLSRTGRRFARRRNAARRRHHHAQGPRALPARVAHAGAERVSRLHDPLDAARVVRRHHDDRSAEHSRDVRHARAVWQHAVGAPLRRGVSARLPRPKQEARRSGVRERAASRADEQGVRARAASEDQRSAPHADRNDRRHARAAAHDALLRRRRAGQRRRDDDDAEQRLRLGASGFAAPGSS